MKNSNRTILKIIILIFLFIAVIAVSLSVGSTFISPVKISKIFISGEKSVEEEIILNLRLPRILLCLIIGSALAASGCIFQAILKNPLSDPYTIGVSGGASLGAVTAIIMYLKFSFVTLYAFLGGIAVIFIILLISKRFSFGASGVILAGIAISFIAQAAVLLIFALSKPEEIHSAIAWLMGDIGMADFSKNGVLALFLLVILSISLFYNKHLDIISFGDKFAKNLGVGDADVRIMFILASLLTAISVSITGVIGFVGLIIPHIMRFIFGGTHIKLLPAACLSGALFLLE